MKFGNILTLFKNDSVDGKSHIKNLYAVALVDGEFVSAENDLINEIARKYSISKNELSEILKKSDGVSNVVPNSEPEKFSQLYDLVLMILADKVIKNEELNLCGFIAVKFGYPIEKAEELIRSVASNILNGRSKQETQERVFRLLK